MKQSVRLGAALAFVLGVSASAGQVRARPPKPPDTDLQCRSLGDGGAEARVAWSRSTRTNGCFFFSGPGDLGRDDQLGTRARYARDGDRITVRFGSAVFVGNAVGDRVVLRRTSNHEYGSTWRVTEVIRARFVESNGCTILRGTYRYQECDTASTSPCPGQCTISTPVTFSQ